MVKRCRQFWLNRKTSFCAIRWPHNSIAHIKRTFPFIELSFDFKVFLFHFSHQSSLFSVKSKIDLIWFEIDWELKFCLQFIKKWVIRRHRPNVLFIVFIANSCDSDSVARSRAFRPFSRPHFSPVANSLIELKRLICLFVETILRTSFYPIHKEKKLIVNDRYRKTQNIIVCVKNMLFWLNYSCFVKSNLIECAFGKYREWARIRERKTNIEMQLQMANTYD